MTEKNSGSENTTPITRKEGKVRLAEGSVWYEALGLPSQVTPLIVVHGGPGYPRDVKPLENLVEKYQRPIIFYDQLGCGNSDRPDEPALWTIDRSVAELDEVIREVRKRFDLPTIHLFGHSFGGSVVAKFLIDKQPAYVASAILASPLLSTSIYMDEVEKLIDTFPDASVFREDIENFIKDGREGTLDNEKYLGRVEQFNRSHVYRKEGDYPPAMIESEEQAGLQVYNTMWGPSEFQATGNLQGFDVVSDLSKIKQPVLFTCGEFDEVTPESVTQFRTHIPGSEMEVFKNSAHMAQFEEPELFTRKLADFLDRVDLKAA